MNKHVGEVHVLTTTLEEVEDLDAVECERLGLKVIEPETSQLTRAATKKRGPLSFCDKLCLLVASDSGFVCVTNDKKLRKACTEEGVGILWGLDILRALVQGNAIPAEDAIQTAEKIHLSNSLHIPRELVDRFAAEIRDLKSEI